ncbi:MAG TPA: RNA polymerase sporulation sigma factor SigG [Clostridiales bacterium]|nr:RNA polymerase sporulation sigma factor SigG [Clostridiales bacterium]
MANRVNICGIDTSSLPKLSNDEMADLMQKLKNGDKNAKKRFVIANLRLVLSVVQRFNAKNHNPDDLFQVGCVGLIKAINNFDTGLNVKFSTYAVPMIIGEIRRFMRDSTSMRVSRSIRDTAYQILKCREKYAKNFKAEPTLEQISSDLGISIKEVSFALDALTEPVSMYDPVYKDGAETVRVMDQIGDNKNNQDEWIENFALKDALKKLSAREKQILLMRYYLGKTQVEVSNEVGISQAQVSRLEKEAIKSMRKDII